MPPIQPTPSAHRATGWVEPEGTAHAVALEVLLAGPLSRAELARRMNLSQASLSRLTKPLLAGGLLVEAGADPGPGRVGRPGRPLDVVPDSHHFVGVKITGTDVHGVLTTLRCEEVARADAPLAGHDVADVVATVASVVARLAEHAPAVTGLGLSVGGRVRDGRVVQDAMFLEWDEVHLADELERATGFPAVVGNDLAALAQAELWFGAGRGWDTFAVLTIGAGVGFGLVAERRVITSDDAGVGLVGHIPLEPGGPQCPLGHRGCASAMLATSSVVAQASVGLGRLVTYEDVLRLAADGDPVARSVVRGSAAALGRLAALAANLTFASTIVLAGEGVGLMAVAGDVARAELDAHRHPAASPVELLVRDADFSEWARGAAAVAIQSYVLSR
ncbi:ROK family protein [Beutenbergia cavernae DSM 12333]|uniref:ROK family protein n=1 Tax=Beutenbergia cavernae (strain ATCC BAA-8 / DSM 12333 / CCUG 43141 / JCM 11478 / NBRC 16432 / NCIMB 13614 / HKI 0122) TaxID=471853 RepID=C5BYG0_BEUC1|nr:ROK family transcriptional regulator [Beutenbergia cavernae]ACQ81060.1 ROK family protein [Beutenbergia cavernae DSM 12333]